MRIYDASAIRSAIDLDADLEKLIEGQKRAFIDAAQDQYETPLPLLLSFPELIGDCHVKAAYRKKSEFFVIKMASGFYRNHEKGLPAGDGALLICSQETGMISALLHDAGFLTTLRTALAGALLVGITPWPIGSIGIIGTGALAKETLSILKRLFPHAEFFLWGRDATKAQALVGERMHLGQTVESVIECSDVVVTTTASEQPIVKSLPVGKKMHIIALGSDDRHKNECGSHLFQQAEQVIVDSFKQAAFVGETFHAIEQGFFSMNKAHELGAVLLEKNPLTAHVIISDLSGIAAQDYEIASFVLNKLSSAE